MLALYSHTRRHTTAVLRNTRNRISLFDVSLRDGIQSADPAKYPFDVKKTILETIIRVAKPAAIEIGSVVSPKILPIMGDSLQLLDHALSYTASRGIRQHFYLLIPSYNQLQKCLPELGRGIGAGASSTASSTVNFSFITSVSDAFQRKNTNRTVDETKQELRKMVGLATREFPESRHKLYISCIPECPISGRIDYLHIALEIQYYFTLFNFDELCLSDTTGAMTFPAFEQILGMISCMGVPPGRLSLHLHGNESNLAEIQKILRHSLDHGIYRFDVSLLDDGGCSVTIASGKTKPNLTYAAAMRAIH